MFNRRGQRMVYLTPQQMQRVQNYNNAGISPSTTVAQRKEYQAKAPKVSRDLYIEIEVKNTSTTQEHTFALFDAYGAYASQLNYVQSGDISITGVSKNYQLLIRKLLTGKYIVKDLHLETLAGKESQFSRTITIWDDSLDVDTISPIKTLYPSSGRNSMQEKLNLQELKSINKTIDANSAIVSTILPQNTYTLRFYLTEVQLS
ncbi:hypothetical protein [Aureispira anguillae]|uniref:Uncharacterized protein n=1 Tax=Aureispira anguillae TaxID=2864201 RepID=A0A916DR33_9BACT|nr:hypothetical protein [Aureispira anguillae]BDS10107.1 hypothetical protein AsAng_0008140 [Aureispira anguillae]